MTNPRAARLRDRLDGLAFGGDYNPEQWPRETWEDDLRLMKQAGVTMVTIGVFSWSMLEPEEGRFDFAWLDDIIDRLHAAGIAVDLATPNAAPPPWLIENYPDARMAHRGGERVHIGSRGHFCPSSHSYRHFTLRIARTLAVRYGAHPALAMWHVGNEYHAECFCELCDARFREWLQRKYLTLDELNERWTTAVWSQRYSDWSQVHLPLPVRGHVNPSRELDFARFVSDISLELFVLERDMLHELTPDIPVTTNFFQSIKLNDYHRWGAEVDIVTFDSYPDPGEDDAPSRAALQYDLMRTVGGGEPWLTLEQAAAAVSQWRRNYVKPPGLMRMDAHRMVARGSDAVMFFQWRAARGGQEKFHSAMLPHGGTAARSWQEVEALGNELPRLAQVAGTRVHADVAVVWDWENWWAVEGAAHPVNDLTYPDIVHRHYRSLWERNIATDVITLDADLSSYKLVVIPNQYLLSAERSRALHLFVENGGHVLVSYFSGIVDEDDRVVENGYPGALRTLIGGHIRDFCPVLPGNVIALTSADGSRAGAPTASEWQDDLVTESARTLLAYDDGFLRGQPAVIENTFGAGRTTYIGTSLDDSTFSSLIQSVLDAAGVRPPLDVPPSVEATERVGTQERFLFLINRGAHDALITLDRPGTDLITSQTHDEGSLLRLAPSGIAVVESRR